MKYFNIYKINNDSNNKISDNESYNIFNLNSIDNKSLTKTISKLIKKKINTIKIKTKQHEIINTFLQNHEKYLNDKYNNLIIDGAIELIPNQSILYKYNIQHGISYTKGCYLGQETTMKLYTNNKKSKNFISNTYASPNLDHSTNFSYTTTSINPSNSTDQTNNTNYTNHSNSKIIKHEELSKYKNQYIILNKLY